MVFDMNNVTTSILKRFAHTSDCAAGKKAIRVPVCRHITSELNSEKDVFTMKCQLICTCNKEAKCNHVCPCVRSDLAQHY